MEFKANIQEQNVIFRGQKKERKEDNINDLKNKLLQISKIRRKQLREKCLQLKDTLHDRVTAKD